MKNFNKYQAISMLAIVMSCGFIACNDDDENYEAPTESKITLGNTGLRVSQVGSTVFEFEKGKLVEFGYYDDYEDRWVVSDNSTKMHFGYSESKYYTSADITNISYNKNGYVTSFKMRWIESYSNGEEEENDSYKCSYDSDGHLTKITCSWSGYYDDYGERIKFSGSSTQNITWKNGRIIYSKYDGTEKEDGEIYKWGDTYDFSYDGDVTKNPLLQPSRALEYTFQLDDLSELVYIGYFGVGSSYFPSSCKREEYEEGDYDDYYDEWENNYTVSLNSDNTINRENYDYYYEYVNSSSKTRAPQVIVSESTERPKTPTIHSNRHHGRKHRVNK